MENLKIRFATVNDAQALLSIYSYYVENTSITFEWEVPTLQEFQNRIENTLKKFPYLVAEKDGQILGYAYASPFKGRKAYEWCVESSIYVEKNSHGQKIGKTLLLELENLLAKQNILNINACIAYADPEDEYLTQDSVRFHKKMGYSMVGQFHQCGYKFNRWYDMVWMEKMLGQHVSEQPEVIFPNPQLQQQ